MSDRTDYNKKRDRRRLPALFIEQMQQQKCWLNTYITLESFTVI